MEENKEVVLRRAKNAVISRDFDLAIRLYKSLLEEDVKNFEILSALGNLYIKAGNDEKALPYFQQILTFSFANFNALNSVGGIYRRLGNYSQSIKFLEKALETGENDAEVNYNLGFTYKMMGNPQDAIACFEKVIAENPTDVLAYNHLGAIYASEKDYKKAIATYQTGLQIDPNHPILQFNMAKSLEAIHDDGAAIKAYETALRSKPSWPEAVESYARMLLIHRKTKQAGDIVQNSINLNPKNPKLYSLQGDIFLNQNNFPKASDSYEKSNELKPEQVEVLCQLAKSYEKSGRLNDALLTIADALKIDEKNVEAQKTQIHALLSANRLKEAGELIKTLYAENKSDTEIIDFAGQFSILKNNDAGAEAYLQKVQEVDPNYTKINFNYAERYKQTGNLENARKHVKAYIDDNMKDTSAWILLGQIEESAGNDEESLDAFGSAIAFDPGNFQGNQLYKKMDEKVALKKQEHIASINRLDLNSFGEEISLDEFGILSDDSENKTADDLNLCDEPASGANEDNSESTDDIEINDTSISENIGVDNANNMEDFDDSDDSEEKPVEIDENDIEFLSENLTENESWKAVDLDEKAENQEDEIDLNVFFADDEINANPVEPVELENSDSSTELVSENQTEIPEETSSENKTLSEEEKKELPKETQVEKSGEKTEEIKAESEEKEIPANNQNESEQDSILEPEQGAELESELELPAEQKIAPEPENQQDIQTVDEPKNIEPESLEEDIIEDSESFENLEELYEAERQYNELIMQVSDLLEPLVSVLKTPEDKSRFIHEVELFRKLKDAGSTEPYEKRAKNLCEWVKYLLELIAAKQFKKIGLLQAAELFLKQGSIRPEATPFEELGKAEIKKTLRNLQGLTDFLEDHELSRTLVLTCETIIEKL